MQNIGVKMHKNKLNGKFVSLFDTLKFFTLNNEGTAEDVAIFIRKDYTTALRVIKKLEAIDFVQFKRPETTRAKGRERKIYEIRLPGLLGYLRFDEENMMQKLGEIAKIHSDKLLTFKKWDYLEGKGLESLIKKSFFRSLENYTQTVSLMFIRLTKQHDKPTFLKRHTDVNTAKAFDVDVLHLPYMSKSPDDLRQILGKKEWSNLMKVFKAIEQDYELRTFRDEFLFWLEKDAEEQLKAVKEWEKLGSI